MWGHSTGYLTNETGPVSLVLDLRIDLTSINGHLHYPNDVDRTLTETVPDKIREYLTDYNNRPSNPISFLTDIPSTSGSLHSEFV